jgi:hypothetical protein
MLQTMIFWPMIGLAGLTLVVTLWLMVVRIKVTRSGEVAMDYYATYQKGSEPDHVIQANRNLTNLFDFPTLFYVVCVLSYLAAMVDETQLYLAWAYVVLRAIHSTIHLTYNEVTHRLGVFLTSAAVLFTLWGRVALSL